MKTSNTINKASNIMNSNELAVKKLHFFKTLSLPICLAVMSISLMSSPANANADQAVSKPEDGKGALPTFVQADINGDHYVTKDELINFPYLLQVFDKIDAGNDGKLEQHEYQNLKIETKREAEVR